MRIYFAILLGKFIYHLTHLLKIGGGSAAPGLYALKIEPDLIRKLAKNIEKTVIITGTNGKTTTARMLSGIAQDQGLKVIRNSTGSNLERGIASSLISAFPLVNNNTKQFDLAIWELDEAAFNTVAGKLNPDMIIFLNVCRDQLDRYGEVDTIIKKWCQTLKKVSKHTTVLVNSDDHNLLTLKKFFTGKVQTFGISGKKIRGEKTIWKSGNAVLDFKASNIQTKSLSKTLFQLQIKKDKYNIHLPLPGIYHVYDALAALAIANNLNLPLPATISQLKKYSPAFGRVEKFVLTPRGWKRKITGMILLIKNPTGANQVLETIAPFLNSNDCLLVALNDNLADGTDVSWIWDANFEVLQNWSHSSLSLRAHPSESKTRAKPGDFKIYVSGTRAEDLAVRLKYAGMEDTRLALDSNLKHTLERARKGLKGRLFILPTYTAMLQLQRILAKHGVKGHYWEEEES